MISFIKNINNLGTRSFKSEQSNQRIRFANTIALLHLVFLSAMLVLLIYQYEFKAAAKLVLISSLIPITTLTLNWFGKTLISRYCISYSLPFFIMFISIFTKWNNPVGSTGFHEFFDTRMLIFVSALVPLLIFSRKNILFLLLALLPSAALLFAYDIIHDFFNVGYTNLFEDPKGGYYLAGIMFNISYLFAIAGILSLKKSNEELVDSNSILINDLNNKNAIQEKLLLRKQELLAQNSKVRDDLLKKQKELLKSKSELELASELINFQKSELQFKNAELTNLVDEKTRELKNANEELLVQNNDLLQFSNTVSHNLRAPVVSMLGLVHLFALEDDAKRREEMIPHIKSSSLALDTIINDLNKVVDIRNQLFNLKKKVSLSEEIEKTELLLKDSLQSKGIKLKTSLILDDLFSVRAYLQSILYNLINNAIKYSNPKVNGEIKIKSSETKNYSMISISDNGIGIDLSKFEQDLFKMYKRFHVHVDGKGMGLYIVKQQVEAMDGTIEVVSEVSKGTTFKIKFLKQVSIERQEYFASNDAVLSYDAELKASFLKWLRTPVSENYREVLQINKEMLANYNSNIWVIDIKKIGLIPDSDRTWFSGKVLSDILKRGCKHIIIIKNEEDGKGFEYWQKMIDTVKNMNVEFMFFYDNEVAVEFIKNEAYALPI